MQDRLKEVLNKLQNNEDFILEDKLELQALLWRIKKVYVFDIEYFTTEQLRVITNNYEYRLLEDKDFKELLNMDRNYFHNKIKVILKKDFKDILSKSKIDNPDFAYYEYEKELYIVMVQPKDKSIVIYTNTPLNFYAND